MDRAKPRADTRAEILAGQLRAAEVLIDLMGARLPPVGWSLGEEPVLYGVVPFELSDQEHYAAFSHWAAVLGTELRTESGVARIPMDDSSDSSYSTGRTEERHWEGLEVEATRNGVRVGFSRHVAPGTAARARVPEAGRVPSSDPVHRAQLQAMTALVQLLNAGLPSATWQIRRTRGEPELSGSLPWARRKQAPEELAEWADFLTTSVRYGRDKRDLGYHRWGEVTGSAHGVPVTVQATTRPPWRVVWQRLRDRLSPRQ
ncbi:hypothetical protein [Streptomyces sp. NRRL WC-3618]|uniref:hypothetical protein n=1 Tax=Streptomyces sp. NRRL WC-3618 TaxID=1519490 RepID=UPI000ABBBF79|nr:hypothetical protein [Streptomyces sp. NRRL WC-3618]